MRIHYLLIGLAYVVALSFALALGRQIQERLNPPPTPEHCALDLENAPTPEGRVCYQRLLDWGYVVCLDAATTHPDWQPIVGHPLECPAHSSP